MIRLLADENFNDNIVLGLRRRRPGFNVLRVRDLGLLAAPDPVALEHAAAAERIVLTQDVRTMAGFAYAGVDQGLAMPGVFEFVYDGNLGVAIEELLLIDSCSDASEWAGQVHFLPFR